MSTITLEDAQARLKELIEHLHPGGEIAITRDQKPVARLTLMAEQEAPRRQLGTLKGTVRYTAPDFDAPLDDFKEYME
jgi:antitoxin (DNA-binding transcriptional repressor) of toxin-antitoxin stability system